MKNDLVIQLWESCWKLQKVRIQLPNRYFYQHHACPCSKVQAFLHYYMWNIAWSTFGQMCFLAQPIAHTGLCRN